MAESFPPPPDDERHLEHGAELTPRFDANGLITAVVTDAADGELLMLAHMNAEALRLTLDTGLAHFYSRSRKALWKKGESSGNLLAVRQILVDCDQDAVWLKVGVECDGVACHTGERSCFYRTVVRNADGTTELKRRPAS